MPNSDEKLVNKSFEPKTPKINDLCTEHFKASTLIELEDIFSDSTNIYIDYANVWHWFDNLPWKLNLKRTYQFFKSFRHVKEIYLYHGTLVDNEVIQEARKIGYKIRTKPVKIIPLKIDIANIPKDSSVLLKQFIRTSFLRKLTPIHIEYLNSILRDLNVLGEFVIEERKCNFDVEMTRDILTDEIKENCKNFVIMSADTDFAPVVDHLQCVSKKVVIFHMSGKLSPELANIGAKRFRIPRIKQFICRNKDIN
jgi:uncharacterized LabA/DUF88 family protein